MTITATIIADSVSPQGIRLTTMQLRYPRFIHAEFMTHRMFSRNASSSRAIPVERLIEDVIRDTAMPIHWGKNQSGMQAREEHNGLVEVYGWGGGTERSNLGAWNLARDNAIKAARAFHAAGYHKQIVNRLLEPFSHINVVVSATEWNNFFALRKHEDAQPEIKKLADEMWWAMRNSEPVLLQPGEWHLPYVLGKEAAESLVGGDKKPNWDFLRRLSVARCARVSYLTHEGKAPLIQSDLDLYERLVSSVPLHASPAEHQATPDEGCICVDASRGPRERKPFWQWNNPHLHGNLRGWQQFRKTLPGECQ